MKATIHSEINRRKELKGKMAQMKKTKWILGETLTKYAKQISIFIHIFTYRIFTLHIFLDGSVNQCFVVLRRLYINISEISDMLETMKANADDQYKLIQLRTQEYQDIIAGYKKTWDEYRVSSKFFLVCSYNFRI